MLLVTRGNDAKPDKPEDPGAIKTFGFDNGALTGLASIAPGTGLGFGPRHLDFHPTKPWVFVSIERQNKLYVYKRDAGTGLARAPMFVKDTLADPKPKVRQAAGAIHVHPSGKFVYLTNRASDLVDSNGTKAFTGGENNVAVFAIDQASGEPTLIQNADGAGDRIAHLRHRAERPHAGRRQHQAGAGPRRRRHQNRSGQALRFSRRPATASLS